MNEAATEETEATLEPRWFPYNTRGLPQRVKGSVSEVFHRPRFGDDVNGMALFTTVKNSGSKFTVEEAMLFKACMVNHCDILMCIQDICKISDDHLTFALHFFSEFKHVMPSLRNIKHYRKCVELRYNDIPTANTHDLQVDEELEV